MKKLFLTLTLMMAITSLTFASFSWTIYNNDQVLSCTYTITAMTIYDNTSNPGCGCITVGGRNPQQLNPGTTYTFTCGCSGSPNWNSLSVTIKGGCGQTYTWGNSNADGAQNCTQCSNQDYRTVWTVLGTGAYEIRPDIIVGRYMNPTPKSPSEYISGGLIEGVMRYGNIYDEIETLNGTISFLENIPNPVSEALNINFELMQDADVEVSILDITGKEVLNAKQGVQVKGKNSINVDVSSLASGMYSYSFKAGDAILTRKFNIVR